MIKVFKFGAVLTAYGKSPMHPEEVLASSYVICSHSSYYINISSRCIDAPKPDTLRLHIYPIKVFVSGQPILKVQHNVLMTRLT